MSQCVHKKQVSPFKNRDIIYLQVNSFRQINQEWDYNEQKH